MRRRAISPFILTLMISFGVILLASIVVPMIVRTDLGATDLANRLHPPFFMEGSVSGHPLGTDPLGRDFLIRTIYATRNSLMIALTGMAIASILGTLMGVLAGLYGRWLDAVVLFLVDVRLSVPTLVIALVFAAMIGSSMPAMIAIIGLTGWASFTRLVRGEMMQLRESTFIECSRSLGASRLRILFEHVLANISSLLIVNGTLRLSSFILLETSLSFLGLGIQPPGVSLGLMVSAGRDELINHWWLAIIPCSVIVLIVLQVSLIGDWVRDRLDPKLKSEIRG